MHQFKACSLVEYKEWMRYLAVASRVVRSLHRASGFDLENPEGATILKKLEMEDVGPTPLSLAYPRRVAARASMPNLGGLVIDAILERWDSNEETPRRSRSDAADLDLSSFSSSSSSSAAGSVDIRGSAAAWDDDVTDWRDAGGPPHWPEREGVVKVQHQEVTTARRWTMATTPPKLPLISTGIPSLSFHEGWLLDELRLDEPTPTQPGDSVVDRVLDGYLGGRHNEDGGVAKAIPFAFDYGLNGAKGGPALPAPPRIGRTVMSESRDEERVEADKDGDLEKYYTDCIETVYNSSNGDFVPFLSRGGLRYIQPNRLVKASVKSTSKRSHRCSISSTRTAMGQRRRDHDRDPNVVLMSGHVHLPPHRRRARPTYAVLCRPTSLDDVTSIDSRLPPLESASEPHIRRLGHLARAAAMRIPLMIILESMLSGGGAPVKAAGSGKGRERYLELVEGGFEDEVECGCPCEFRLQVVEEDGTEEWMSFRVGGSDEYRDWEEALRECLIYDATDVEEEEEDDEEQYDDRGRNGLEMRGRIWWERDDVRRGRERAEEEIRRGRDSMPVEGREPLKRATVDTHSHILDRRANTPPLRINTDTAINAERKLRSCIKNSSVSNSANSSASSYAAFARKVESERTFTSPRSSAMSSGSSTAVASSTSASSILRDRPDAQFSSKAVDVTENDFTPVRSVLTASRLGSAGMDLARDNTILSSTGSAIPIRKWSVCEPGVVKAPKEKYGGATLVWRKEYQRFLRADCL
ncbi:hypothetical protein HK101_001560 [Irineochytrium annulatum]|nr:hypothetical protein HK101_001560 [Irineochytrium annulatum]